MVSASTGNISSQNLKVTLEKQVATEPELGDIVEHPLLISDLLEVVLWFIS